MSGRSSRKNWAGGLRAVMAKSPFTVQTNGESEFYTKLLLQSCAESNRG